MPDFLISSSILGSGKTISWCLPSPIRARAGPVVKPPEARAGILSAPNAEVNSAEAPAPAAAPVVAAAPVPVELPSEMQAKLVIVGDGACGKVWAHELLPP